VQLGLYQHYNGNFYHAMCICRHSETLEEMVVYRALYADYGVWVRPKEIFAGKVTHGGKLIDRFTFVRELNIEPPVLR